MKEITDEALAEVGIKRKGKIAQYFCRHSNTQSFTVRRMLLNLNGDPMVDICKDCGKTVKEWFKHDW